MSLEIKPEICYKEQARNIHLIVKCKYAMVDFFKSIIINSFFSEMKKWVPEIVTTFSSILYLGSRGGYNETHSFNAISPLLCISSTELGNNIHFNNNKKNGGFFSL